MTVIEIETSSGSETTVLGRAVGKSIPPGIMLALSGTLGAGKTFLVQSIAEGLEVPRDVVVSPTFSMIQIYHGRIPLVHIDAYRIADEDEFFELGIEEYFEDASCIVAMEWADRFAELLPESRIECEITVEPSGRRIQFRAHGAEPLVIDFFASLEQLTKLS